MEKGRQERPGDEVDFDSDDSTIEGVGDPEICRREGVLDLEAFTSGGPDDQDSFTEEGLQDHDAFMEERVYDSDALTIGELDEISRIFKKLAVSCLIPVIGNIWWLLLTDRLAKLIKEAGRRNHIETLEDMGSDLANGFVWGILFFPVSYVFYSKAFCHFMIFLYEHVAAPEKHRGVKLSYTMVRDGWLVFALGFFGIQAFLMAVASINSILARDGLLTPIGLVIAFIGIGMVLVIGIFIILNMIDIPVRLVAISRWMTGLRPDDLKYVEQPEFFLPHREFILKYRSLSKEKDIHNKLFLETNMIAFKQFKREGAYRTRAASMEGALDQESIHMNPFRKEEDETSSKIAWPWFW